MLWHVVWGPPGTAWGSSYVPNQSDAFVGVSNTKGAWHRLAASGYVPYNSSNYTPTGNNLCSGILPDGWHYFGGAYSSTFGLFAYNGPHCGDANMGNNSPNTGLYVMGRHDKGVGRGVRFFGNPPSGFTWDKIAFLACPSVYKDGGGGVVMEPHGFQSARTGAGQGDAPWYGPLANFRYDRNYLYGDLHAEYLHAASREGLP